MFKPTLHRALLLFAALVSPLLAQAADSTNPASSGLSAEAVLIDLDHRLDALQAQLNAIRDGQSEALRQSAMERHWQMTQDYMEASLKMAVHDPASSRTGVEGCHMVGATWMPLAFPGQIRSDDYLKAMQHRMGQMREDLLSLHAARDPDVLNGALQKHWQSNYQFLQGLRGLDWMFSGWTPAQPGNQTLPDPGSEGAQLTQTYCSVCHAVPKARLHTAMEWAGVMATMNQHMARSDSGFPLCVRLPSPEEFQTMTGYLVKYAR